MEMEKGRMSALEKSFVSFSQGRVFWSDNESMARRGNYHRVTCILTLALFAELSSEEAALPDGSPR